MDKQLLKKFIDSLEEPSDEYVIRKGLVYDIGEPGDDRLQIQIIPDLYRISDDELKNLPKWPPFFKRTYHPYKTVKKDGKEKAAIVLCVCTPDLQTGFVLGEFNPFLTEASDLEKNSWPFKRVKNFLDGYKLSGDDFDYGNISVELYTQDENGGLLVCYNKVNGDLYVMNSTGAIITLQGGRIYMRVGSPANPTDSGPIGFSSIDMRPDNITINAQTVEFNARHLVLGHHNLKVLGTFSKKPLTSENGLSATPIDTIQL